MYEVHALESSEISKIKKKLAGQLDILKKGRVLVVGDVCLDEYLLGEVKRISPEAPVPVVDVQSQEKRLGLAANVAQNVVSLGGQCRLIGVVGNDTTREELTEILDKAGVSSQHLIVDPSRPTTRKTRIMAGNHHITRVDFEQRKFLSESAEREMLAKVNELLPEVDIVVIEDYAKGVFSYNATQQIIEQAQVLGKKVAVDPHRTTPIKYYRGADIFKPNRDEAFILSGLNLDDLRESRDSLGHVAQQLKELVDCEHLIVTLGKHGIVRFEEEQGFGVPTSARQVYDVAGAGDTVLAALSLGVAAGFNLNESCILANCAAGVVVSKIGCVPCELDELLSHLNS